MRTIHTVAQRAAGCLPGWRKSVAAITAATLAATLAGGASAGASSDPGPRPAGSAVALTGTADVSLQGAYFIVYVWPRQEIEAALQIGDEVPLYQLPSTAVSTSGPNFTISVDPSDLPADYLNDGGLIHLEVDIVAPGEQLWANTAASMAIHFHQGRLRWVDPLDVEALAADEANPGFSTAAPPPVHVDVTLDPAPASVQQALSKPEPSRALATEPGITNGCGTLSTKIEQRSLRWVRIGRTHPVGTSTGNMQHSSSRSMTFGGAVSAAGIWKSSGTKTLSTTTTHNFTASSTNRGYEIEAEYGRYHRSYSRCGTLSRRWDVVKTTSGRRTVSVSAPTWNRCATRVSAGTWSRDTSSGDAFHDSVGVKIKALIGIDLSLRRQYSTGSKLIYNIKGSNKTLCGDTDYPDYSRNVREKTR